MFARKILKITTIILAMRSVFGCAWLKPDVLDGPGMVYYDKDYRSEYANVFDFGSIEGKPYFLVAFLGYGDIIEFRNTYVKGVFESLSQEQKDKILHFDFDGDEWYLIIPRYKDVVEITNLDTLEKQIINQGDAFTVKCNLSDLHSNIEISTEDGYGAHRFSPQMSGEGRLITNAEVLDITDYGVLDENLYVQGGE